MRNGRIIIATAAALALFACSTTATIQRVDGPDNEATIEGSDKSGILVSGGSGRFYHIKCSQIRDIDHPGNVMAIVGASMVGAAGLIFASTSSSGNDRETRNLAIAFYGLPGLGLTLWGGFNYSRSKETAKVCEDPASPRALGTAVVGGGCQSRALRSQPVAVPRSRPPHLIVTGTGRQSTARRRTLSRRRRRLRDAQAQPPARCWRANERAGSGPEDGDSSMDVLRRSRARTGWSPI